MLWMALILAYYTGHGRTINMILLVLIIAGYTTNMIVRRDKTIRRTRRIGGWLFMMMCNFVYAYSFSIREHRPYNAAVGISTVIMLGTIVAIIWHPDGDNRPPPNDGAWTNRFMFWLDERVRSFKARHRKEKR
jgi:hypothetical protein